MGNICMYVTCQFIKRPMRQVTSRPMNNKEMYNKHNKMINEIIKLYKKWEAKVSSLKGSFWGEIYKKGAWYFWGVKIHKKYAFFKK